LPSRHRERILELAAALDQDAGETARWGSLLLKGFAARRAPDKPEVDFSKIEPLKLPVETLNVFATASFLLGDQEAWQEWFLSLRDVLVPHQRSEAKVCEAGSWDGETFRDRAQATALRCLTLEHYRCYYCRNPFRKKK